MEERIVCAAIQFKSGLIVCSARHFDPGMHMVNDLIQTPHDPGEAEQGFINQRGEFLNREEAWKVAESAGQISRRVGGDRINGGHLFSENLY